MTTLELNINGVRRSLLVALALLLLCGPVAAQDDNTAEFKFLEVTVLDPDGKPAVDATIDVNLDGLEFPMTADENGVVSLNLPTGGSLDLVIRQPGCVPVTAHWRRGKQVPGEYTVRLEKAEPVVGKLVDADGKPVRDARVFTATPDVGLTIANGRVDSNTLPAATTDGEGKFSLPYPELDQIVVCLHDSGWAQLAGNDLTSDSPTPIVLTAWSRVGGIVRRGKQITPREQVSLKVLENNHDGDPAVTWEYSADSNDDGAFSFDHVVARRLAASRTLWFTYKGEQAPLESHTLFITPVASETSNIVIGGSGRTVTGTLSVASEELRDADWSQAYVELKEEDFVADTLGRAFFLYGTSLGVGSTWGRGQPQPIRFPESTRKTYATAVAPDGSFEIADVPSGRYLILADLFVPLKDDPKETKLYTFRQRGYTILNAPEGHPDAPVDLGTLELKPLQ